MKRTPKLQSALDEFAEKHQIEQSFIEASDHPYDCRCDFCRDWWGRMGPDPETGSYGPFSPEEIEQLD